VELITCHCDNEAGIDKINRPIASPGECLGADMDIVMAIQRLIRRASCQIIFKHVKGHVERDRP
jgi:hypothetical protein